MNPHSGAADRVDLVRRLEKSLRDVGFLPEILTQLDQVKLRAAELEAAGDLRVLIGAGGDGTISRLVNELPPGLPMAIFPLGTENLLAKYLHHPADPAQFADLIRTGKIVDMDAGLANGKIFLIMASCGFDADVVERLHAQRQGHIRHWSYAKPILESITKYPYPQCQIWVDDCPNPIECRWAFIFNVPKYAMNLPIVTDANPTDGLLELCSFQEGNLLRGLYYLAAVLTGRHRNSSESHFCRFKKLKIAVKDPGQKVPFQLDGDPGGDLPLAIEIQTGKFKVFVSSDWKIRI